MDLQIPHVNKLGDDDQPICRNVDLSHHKTDPHDVLLVIPDNRKFDFDFSSDSKKLSSQPNNNESYVAPRLHKFISKQDLRKELLRRWSSFLVSTVVFIGLFYNIWSTILLPMQKQRIHRFYIWSSFLGLLGFIVFVSAVAVMILAGGVFSSTQKAMLIILLLWMHIQSAKSILEVCVILLGGVFMAWYAFWKKESPTDESDTNKGNKLSAQTVI
ncbi:uncharacterized protein LOC131609905 isoform X2 [Vicia villosa]|uniref:uncharacterized protein LOC131609905 isoform X2 n=1 Tax=Vicia villosa TaxID=3911 RepID=UPI00273B4CDB|nr:uncharacterized protein LOC131609905 isoform X2 [Vicia villosa]